MNGGVTGYITKNKGTSGNPYIHWEEHGKKSGTASLVPFYSVHALGIQSNLIVPKPGLLGFFKYYWEYAANARVLGRTIVFGFTWNYKIPKKTAK